MDHLKRFLKAGIHQVAERTLAHMEQDFGVAENGTPDLKKFKEQIYEAGEDYILEARRDKKSFTKALFRPAFLRSRATAKGEALDAFVFEVFQYFAKNADLSRPLGFGFEVRFKGGAVWLTVVKSKYNTYNGGAKRNHLMKLTKHRNQLIAEDGFEKDKILMMHLVPLDLVKLNSQKSVNVEDSFDHTLYGHHVWDMLFHQVRADGGLVKMDGRDFSLLTQQWRYEARTGGPSDIPDTLLERFQDMIPAEWMRDGQVDVLRIVEDRRNEAPLLDITDVGMFLEKEEGDEPPEEEDLAEDANSILDEDPDPFELGDL